MTFLEWLNNRLYNSGLFPEQIDKVMPIIITHPVNDTMSGRWTDSISNYPPAIQNLLWLSTCKIVLNWIDQNCPKAWFRSMFDLDDPIHKMAADDVNNEQKERMALDEEIYDGLSKEAIRDYVCGKTCE